MKHIYPSLSSCLYNIGFFEITSFPGVKFDNAYYSCPRFPSNFFIYSNLNILVSEVMFSDRVAVQPYWTSFGWIGELAFC